MATFGFPSQTNLNNPQSLITNAANMVFSQPPPQNQNLSFIKSTSQTPSFGNIDDSYHQNPTQPNTFNYSNPNHQSFTNGGISNPTFQNIAQPNFTSASFQSNSFAPNNASNFGLATQNFQANNNLASNSSFMGGRPEQGNMLGMSPSVKKFQPQRSKNTKIDSKHLVKCITLADGNTNMCIKEFRIAHILQGNSSTGQFGQPNGSAFGAPPTSSFGFGSFSSPQKQNMGFNATTAMNTGVSFGNNTNPIISTPIKTTNNFSLTNPVLGNNLAGKSQFSFNPSSNNMPFSTTNQSAPFSSIIPNSTTQTMGSPYFQTGQQSTNSFLSFPQTNTPTKGIFAPADNNSVTVFPKLLANPSTTPAINNAAISLAANIMKPVNQTYGNQFQSQPTMNQNGSFQPNPMQGYQNMLLHTFFNSQFFRNIVSQNAKEPYDKLTEEAKRKSAIERTLKFGEEDEIIDHSYNRRLKKKADKIQFIQKPYLFNEVQINSFYSESATKFNEKQDINFKPTRLKMKNEEILKKTFLEEFQQNFNKFHQKTLKEILVKPTDLPVNDSGFVLSPNIEQLSGFSHSQLKRVKNVCIENKYGKVKFRVPVNLLGKRLSQCIRIEQDLVEIIDPEWGSKECEMSFKNFGNYISAGEVEKRKTERKIRKWAEKNNMHIENFDKETGNLMVTLI